MTRQTQIVGLGALVLAVGAFAVVMLTRSAPEPAAPDTAAGKPAPSRPRGEMREAKPEVVPAPARRRREPSEGTAPEPEAPTVVETAPETGTLHIDSDIPGAQVFIDRQFVGTAPVTAHNVAPGSHQLNVSAEGYDGIANTIDVEPGPREIRGRFREVRLNLAVEVVHKHGIGSCKGRLIATARGLRYDTTNKDDMFNVGLLDMETFQVDYLEKNLKVKPRKGKQYNFTDPGGNADKLFVFHRDVEKARERLKKGDTPAE